MHVKNTELPLCQEEKARVIQTLLFVAGINTLCQSFFGTRLPAVLGGSYTVVAPTISIIMASRYSNETDPREVAPSSIVAWCTRLPLSYALFIFSCEVHKSLSLLFRNSCGLCEEPKVL